MAENTQFSIRTSVPTISLKCASQTKLTFFSLSSTCFPTYKTEKILTLEFIKIVSAIVVYSLLEILRDSQEREQKHSILRVFVILELPPMWYVTKLQYITN